MKDRRFLGDLTGSGDDSVYEHLFSYVYSFIANHMVELRSIKMSVHFDSVYQAVSPKQRAAPSPPPCQVIFLFVLRIICQYCNPFPFLFL